MKIKRKMYHRAIAVNEKGGVMALCFSAPRSIDLKRATWTNRDEAVTCPKCLKLMGRNKPIDHYTV